MWYVIKWETTRYYLVGPFRDDIKAFRWGEKNAAVGETYTGWDVLELVDPAEPPKVLDPQESAPAEPEPLHVTLRPSLEFFRTDDGTPMRSWYGHTNTGTPIVAFIAAVAARERVPGEPVMGPYCGHEALARELASIPGPPMPAVRINPGEADREN